MAVLKNTSINDTGYLKIPSGTTAQRPTVPAKGMFRYNTDLKTSEYYNGSQWIVTSSNTGLTPLTAVQKSTDILVANPLAPTGWYWIIVNGTPRRYWVDNTYDGGGWVLVGSHPINVAIPALTYYEAAQSYTAYSSSTYGIGIPLSYSVWVGLNGWDAIVTANNAGRNIVYYTAGSQVQLGATSSHSRRSRWKWNGWNSLFSWNNANSLVNELGGVTPGIWSYHITNNYNFSTYDRDQDTYTPSCSPLYNNAPFWYGSCWDGNLWGANGGATYANAAYWTGSGGDYYNYGGIYVK